METKEENEIKPPLKFSNGVDHTKKVIEIIDVSFSYGNDEVLSGISLDVHKGDYLGLVGPNGAGKTTLLKIMLGLLRPTKGEVKIFGTELKEFDRWADLGYVPQKATNFDPNFPATVKEVVLMGRTGRKGLLRQMNKKDEELAEKALREVGMEQYEHRLIGDLSGGQQQRIFIARALAAEPQIIFLDEPTSGVDMKTQDDFYALMKKLNQELDLTLVLVSHDIEKIMGEIMHVVCVDKTLVCHETPEEFLKDSHSRVIAGENVKFIGHHH
ncbi:MAG: metal ABC transporter ATP-binding protein [Candidatus Paceibacterota bacterium]|jgi:zinc transport system ATP-binding protein|nr:metal ABC transporter ATP-binding protein [Candidatus Paceibacterota bacterium]